MPIVLRHQAAGIAPDQENPRTKYGMAMVLQQQRSDQEMRQRTQDQQYDMQRMGAMGANQAMREPSIGEDDAMLEQEIRSGLYDPDTVRALRQDQRAMRQIMRDTNIDGTQRAQALGNLQSRMRMSRSTGKVQPMQQQMPQQVGQGGQQQRRLSGREAFRADPKLEDKFLAMVDQQAAEAGVVLPYKERLQRALNFYDERETALSEPDQNQQPPAQNQPQASYTGGQSMFGASPVMAQGGMSAPVGQGAYQPTGSYTSPEVFGQANVLVNPAQPSQQQPAPMQTPATPAQQQPEKNGKRGYISIAPGGGQSAGQPAGQASGGWKSKSTGVYSPDGKFLGDPSLYDEAGANYIRQQAAPTAASKPPVATSGRDAAFNAATSSNLDTAYDLANMDRSPGTNYFNPENPEYARMRGADPNIMNPPKNVGKFKGRYGLGGMDYGINPATGNRVTMSVRPGGGLEYDEPTGGPRRGGVTVMGGKNKPAPAAQQQGVVGVDVSPGEGVDPKYAALPVSTPANSSDAAAYQYQSPLAQAASAAMSSPQPSAPAAPASKYGRSASTSALGREVDAAMQAGEELEANEQQRAVEIATSPSPEPMSDAERKRLGLPTLKEMEEMRKSIDRNKTMGGIGLGGTGRAAGSYEPIKADKLPKGKEASTAAQQKKASPQQTGMSQSLIDFASKQRPDVQNAIKEAYNPKLSERARENAIRFLLTQGIDLSEIL